MKIYLTPTDLQGNVVGDVVICDSRRAAEVAIARFKALGYPGVQQTRGDIVCDFCSFPEVKWCYKVDPGHVYAVDIDTNDTHIDRDGLWGACETCCSLISADDWDGITERSTIAVFKMGGVTDPTDWEMMVVAGSIQAVHATFRKAWDGGDPDKVISDAEFLANAGIEHEATCPYCQLPESEAGDMKTCGSHYGRDRCFAWINRPKHNKRGTK